ncbi:serpin family protein [Streptomyces sp. NPDC048604]|uniref:serpin family protein n=1 Tax=Streptomyces sp. NPDC048604 TaxID=3365578 RepID=UPI0037121831
MTAAETSPAQAALPAVAVRALASRWLPRLGDDDFVCSPAGLWLALGAVAAGAGGGTAKELAELVGVPGEEAAAAVTGVSRVLDASGAVAVATGVWSRVPVREAYREALPGVGFGVLQGQEPVDAWVRAATDGMIERLPLTIGAGAALVLVNALALKAVWQARFDPARTCDAPFTDGYGDTSAVPTMHRLLPASWAWRVGGATVVELPCEGPEGGALRVRFVLGEDRDGPAEALPAAWAEPARRTPLAAEGIELALPRFSVRTVIDVHAQLAALGVTEATDRERADFSRLSPEPLYVSDAAQEAYVRVAEEGVEAAAATAVVMTRSRTAAPQLRRVERIAFDRPFGFAVLDATGALPLFAGWRSSAPGGE